jgi:hypothetical protein
VSGTLLLKFFDNESEILSELLEIVLDVAGQVALGERWSRRKQAARTTKPKLTKPMAAEKDRSVAGGALGHGVLSGAT